MSALRLAPAAIFVFSVIVFAVPPHGAAAQESNSTQSGAAKSAQAQPPAKAKATPKRNQNNAPVPETATPVPSSSAGCGWIGKRVIHSLLRDDAVTAQDFDRLYHTFNCGGEQLRAAFDCTVAVGAMPTAAEAQTRVDSCWNDPKFDTKATKIAPSSEPATGGAQTQRPAAAGSQPKSGAGKAAPAVTGATPNYPEPKPR